MYDCPSLEEMETAPTPETAFSCVSMTTQQVTVPL